MTANKAVCITLVTCAFFIGLCAEAFAVCRVPIFRTPGGGVGSGKMTATAGKPCKIVGTPLNAMTVTIEQRPSHGTLTVGDYGAITYTARSGYVGSDSFAYARRGRDDFGVPVAVRRAKVAVTVLAPTIYDR